MSEKNVVYRCIGNDFNNGIVACGYMKKNEQDTHRDFRIDYYSCFFLINGKGTYRSDEYGEYPIGRGDFVQRIPGITHTTIVDPKEEWVEFFFSFGKTTYDSLVSLGLLTDTHPVIALKHLDQAVGMFDAFLQKMKKATDTELPLMLLSMQELIYSLLITHDDADMEQTMKKACQILSNEGLADCTLEAVAAQLDMSYEHFRKKFKEAIGLSPAAYRIEQRMKQAKLMLMSGMPIKDVAVTVGYGDTFAFTKQFTNKVGMSPGRYIKQNLLSDNSIQV